MTGFDLRSLVFSTRAETGELAPTVLAKEVIARIKNKDFRAALDESVPAFVQAVISRDRGHPRAPLPDGSASMEEPGPKGEATLSRADRRRMVFWRRRLESQFCVGPDPARDHKLLGDCTITDLEYAVALREKQARETLAVVGQCRELIGMLRQHGVDVVRQLPDEVLAVVLAR